MKRTFVYCSIIIWTLVLIASCGHNRLVVHGFVDEPQDSLFLDLKEYVYPASEVYLSRAVKSNGFYYLVFDEQGRFHDLGSKRIIMAISEDNLQTKHIPLPKYVDDFSFISVINDTLVIGSRDADQGYCLDPKEWEWTPYLFHTDHNDTLFEDDDWSVKHSDHGEFGSITWFINKHLQEEYAFGGLYGNIHRIDSTLFIVSPTRVYALSDPSIGFHCDSTTTYESAKDVHLIGVHFSHAGYSLLEHNFLPVVHFDNEPAEIVERTFGDFSYYDGGFYVSEFAKVDTAILGSFVASDTLFCALHTPSGLELVKLDNDRLSVVHCFNKDLGVYSRYSFYGHYPDVSSVSKYRDDSDPAEDKLLILVNDKAGSSELFGIGRDGNTLLKLYYNASGLNPVDQDGFGELLAFYLKNWNQLALDGVIQKEKTLGGEISYLNLGADRNQYPPEDIFKKDESYHIDVVSKQIDDSYEVQSEYWVQESDHSIPVIFMDWSRLRYDSGFDPEAKYKELVEAITEAVGQDPVIRKTDRNKKYTEWHSGERSIQLYGTDYDVRFLMF